MSPSLRGNQYSDFHHHRCVFPAHRNETTQYALLCLFLSVNIVSMAFIFVVLSVVYSLKNCCVIVHHLNIPEFFKKIYSVYVQCGFFPGLAVMNEAAVTVLVQVLRWTYVLISLGNKPRCGTAGSSRRHIFSFSKYCQFPKVVETIYTSVINECKFHLLYILDNTCYCQFNFSYVSG